MTLTVRLDETLEAALERYCAATGSSKSLVVQESLATYLLEKKQLGGMTAHASADPVATPVEPSPLFKMFQEAGLIGGGELGGQSATNAEVRKRVLARLSRQRP